MRILVFHSLGLIFELDPSEIKKVTPVCELAGYLRRLKLTKFVFLAPNFRPTIRFINEEGNKRRAKTVHVNAQSGRGIVPPYRFL